MACVLRWVGGCVSGAGVGQGEFGEGDLDQGGPYH